jgi:hypothetical protein
MFASIDILVYEFVQTKIKLADLLAKRCFGGAKAAATHASRCKPLAARSSRNGDSVLTD